MIVIDPPAVPRYGRTWSHLASDTSYDELHVFAAASASRFAGSTATTTTCLGVLRRGRGRRCGPGHLRDLVVMLVRAGLRRRKHALPTAANEEG